MSIKTKLPYRFFILTILIFLLLFSYYVISQSEVFVNKSKIASTINPHLKFTSYTSSVSLLKYQKYDRSIYRHGNGKEEIKIAIVLCGDRLNQTLNSLKSALVFSKRKLHFIVIADKKNQNGVKTEILKWPESVLNFMSFEIHDLSFPEGKEGDEWKNLFKLCASQRLFLPSLLSHIDSLLYIDSDVLFLQPVEKLWSLFVKFNSTQIAALCPENEDFSTGWYNRFATHPFYKPLGVNSGVMLMNLTRMRAFHWEKYLSPIMKEYKMHIVWGDQDIINIIFYFHSDKLYIFPCQWNYRPDHCMYQSICKSAESNGISVIHGSRGVFFNKKEPSFKAIYNSFAQYNFSGDIKWNIVTVMEVISKQTKQTNCGRYILDICTKHQKYI